MNVDSGAAALRAAWARSDLLFGLLDPTALLTRPIPLRQPFLFYIGHLAAFAGNHLVRGVLGRASFDETLDALFTRGIDPRDDAVFVTDDSSAWPPLDDILDYRDRVREILLPVLDAPELAEVIPMVIEHELMHHETLTYMVLQLPPFLKPRPPFVPREPCPKVSVEPSRAAIPEGRAVLGAPKGGGFRWDNEHPELAVDVPAFALDTLPVTNSEFRDFVEAGGYTDRRLWWSDGWDWRERRGMVSPPFWRGLSREFRVATVFEDVPFEEAADWPVYVTHCEAWAYARWSGARLPSEAEVHRAAFATPDGSLREHPWGDEPPGPEHANLGFRRWAPAPAGAHPAGASAFGVHELVGNGWEWTSTPFQPLPGFEPLPRYPGYSADFFDGRHFVLLGASWATDERLVRRSFRNWFQPHYPYVFAKFRRAWPT